MLTSSLAKGKESYAGVQACFACSRGLCSLQLPTQKVQLGVFGCHRRIAGAMNATYSKTWHEASDQLQPITALDWSPNRSAWTLCFLLVAPRFPPSVPDLSRRFAASGWLQRPLTSSFSSLTPTVHGWTSSRPSLPALETLLAHTW